MFLRNLGSSGDEFFSLVEQAANPMALPFHDEASIRLHIRLRRTACKLQINRYNLSNYRRYISKRCNVTRIQFSSITTSLVDRPIRTYLSHMDENLPENFLKFSTQFASVLRERHIDATQTILKPSCSFFSPVVINYDFQSTKMTKFGISHIWPIQMPED